MAKTSLDASRGPGNGVGSFLLALLSCACQEAAPARVQLEVPDPVLSTEPVKALVWTYGDRNEKNVGKGPYDYTVEPPDLAAVSREGQLTCARSGDGTVAVTVVGVNGAAPLRCRLVDRIEAPDLGRIDVAQGPVELNVGAYSKDGERFADVPVSLTTRNASVARAMGSKLEPLLVGEAKLTARAGQVTKDFIVQVVRKLEPEALPIQDGKRIHFSLEPGRYELVVELDSSKKMDIEWRGAPYCNATKTSKVHQSDCVLRTKGGVVFDNPTFLNTGSKEVSHSGIRLHEVPSR